MDSFKKLERKIKNDHEKAHRYLLTGKKDRSKFSKAVKIVFDNADPHDKALILSRRAAAKGNTNPEKYDRWVVRTQLQMSWLSERDNLNLPWESEHQIKRNWKRIVNHVVEIAVRL